MNPLALLDRALFYTLNRGVGTPLLDGLMLRLTGLNKLAWFMALISVYAIWVLCKGDRRARIWVMCALVAVGLSDVTAGRVVKRIAPRDRPCYQMHTPKPDDKPYGPMAFAQTRLVGECPGSKSFPSNHASNMMAVGLVCWWFTKGKKRWLWFLLPAVIGYTRIYLGYHYPSDVLGGWVLGAVVGSLVLWCGSQAQKQPG